MSTMVSFVSTRGQSEAVGFLSAVMNGLAPDGGLYIPVSVPDIDFDALDANTYAEFASQMLACWIADEVGTQALNDVCTNAFNFDVPLVPLTGGDWEQCHILELFHGPTNSFKDFGARFTARAMAGVIAGTNEKITVLVATSGDTGSAVADAYSGLNGIRVILLYPDAQVSAAQERQLIVKREGVVACRVDGNFDDCQKMVKGAFAEPTSYTGRLSTANSINVGRLLPQMVYFAWSTKLLNDQPLFCVPSGNLGNLTGGILAQLSGLRCRDFLASHNANSFFSEYLEDASASFRPSVATLSNAMDVGAPSNFERLRALLDRRTLVRVIKGTSVSDDETLETIRTVYEKTGYIADPHTAVGLEGIRRHRNKTDNPGPSVILSTAHPAKFADTVEAAIGIHPEMPEQLSSVWDQEISVRPIPATQKAIQDIITEEH